MPPDSPVDLPAAAAVSASGSTRSGFVYSDLYAGSDPANSKYSYNSAGRTNRIVKKSTGVYEVVFPGLGATGGIGQATAVGTSSNYCTAYEWKVSGTDEAVTVRCYSKTGAATDSKFTASFVRHRDSPSGTVGAYVLDDNPEADFHAPAIPSHWNPFGFQPTIERIDGTYYLVTLPATSFAHGNVQVNAYKTSKRCKAGNWGLIGETTLGIVVYCTEPGGAPVRRGFSVWYDEFKLNGLPTMARARADQPTKSDYAPNLAYQFGGVSGVAQTSLIPPYSPIMIKRTGTGKYDVNLPPVYNSAGGKHIFHVTAVGINAIHCKLSSYTHIQAKVGCWDGAGNAADSEFSITFQSTLAISR